MLLGFFVNEAIARALKHALQHPRPLDHCERLDLCDSHGMPSSHTQCAFFAFILHMCLAARHWKQKSKGTRICAAAEVAALGCAAPLIGLSRVYLGYHHIDQVVVGCVIGCAFAAIWYACMHTRAVNAARRRVAAALSCLAFKDTWHIADPLAVEWEAYRAHKPKQL